MQETQSSGPLRDGPLVPVAGVPAADPKPVRLGPFPLTYLVQGVAVSVPLRAELSIQRSSESLTLNVRLVADLADLQAKAGAIVDTFPLPTDRCGHKGLDNLVVRLWGKDLSAAAEVATLTLHGDAEVWGCVDVPFLGTKNERLAQQPFDASLPFRLVRRDARTIGLELGDPRIDLGGSLGGVTQGLLQLLGVDLGGQAKGALSQAVLPGLLNASLPEAKGGVRLAFQGASFGSEGGHLVARVDVAVEADGNVLAGVLQILRAFGGGRR